MEITWLVGLTWAAKIIVVFLALWALADVRKNTRACEKNAKDIKRIKSNNGYTDNRIGRHDKVHTENIDRLKLANFFMLQGKTEEAMDVLSGRVSKESIKQELYELRRAIVRGGDIDPLWILEKTETPKE